jgi:hypothetical protein
VLGGNTTLVNSLEQDPYAEASTCGSGVSPYACWQASISDETAEWFDYEQSSQTNTSYVNSLLPLYMYVLDPHKQRWIREETELYLEAQAAKQAQLKEATKKTEFVDIFIKKGKISDGTEGTTPDSYTGNCDFTTLTGLDYEISLQAVGASIKASATAKFYGNNGFVATLSGSRSEPTKTADFVLAEGFTQERYGNQDLSGATCDYRYDFCEGASYKRSIPLQLTEEDDGKGFLDWLGQTFSAGWDPNTYVFGFSDPHYNDNYSPLWRLAVNKNPPTYMRFMYNSNVCNHYAMEVPLRVKYHYYVDE